MRATIRNLLLANAPLMALIPASRWYQLGDVLDAPVKPFAILRWITPVTGNASGTFAHQLRVDIHGKRGSYVPVDQILGGPYRTGGVYSVLSPIMGVTGPDGYVAQADYLGESGDDVDVDYKSNFKYNSWQIAGRSF